MQIIKNSFKNSTVISTEPAKIDTMVIATLKHANQVGEA